jgi:hypothetical protein
MTAKHLVLESEAREKYGAKPMIATESSAYHPSLLEKARVRLLESEHPQNLQAAVILRALPNPSQRAVHQWYDVRFDNGILGRFLEKYLEPIIEGRN